MRPYESHPCAYDNARKAYPKPGLFRARRDLWIMLAWLAFAYLVPIVALYLATR